jgi:hypothetical protein
VPLATNIIRATNADEDQDGTSDPCCLIMISSGRHSVSIYLENYNDYFCPELKTCQSISDI